MHDGEQVAQIAHTVKGSVVNFGGRTAGQAALQIEERGRAADFEEIDLAIADLETKLRQLSDCLEAVVQEKCGT